MHFHPPTVVVMYHLNLPENRKEAEFRLSPDGAVSLTVFDPDAESIARLIYEHGMVQVGGISRATGEDGQTFMRSLLEPRTGGTYTIFVDESPPDPDVE